MTQAICTMASFYYRYQNLSEVRFLVQIGAFCYLNLNEITRFKYERKNEMNSGLSIRTVKDVIMQTSSHFVNSHLVFLIIVHIISQSRIPSRLQQLIFPRNYLHLYEKMYAQFQK